MQNAISTKSQWSVIFFAQLPNKLRASSVIPTLRLLKSEPASNYAKFLESFQTGKRNQEPSKPNKEHQTTTTPGSHEKNTMVSQVICSAQKRKNGVNILPATKKLIKVWFLKNARPL